MSITSDLRGYADNAIEQGRQVLEQAQGQLNDVTGQANEFVGKLTETAKENVTVLTGKATELRSQAEKAVNLDAIKAAVEPYLAQAKGYTHSVTDRAEALLNTAKKDPRVAKAFDTAETVTERLVETVQEKLVKPVQSLARRNGAPAAKPAKATSAAAKPAATKPATKPATTRAASKAPARKATTRKATATKTPKA